MTTTTPHNTRTPLISSSSSTTITITNPVPVEEEGGGRREDTNNMTTTTTAICKSVSAVLLSIVVAMILSMLNEGIGSILYPFPEDFGGTMEEIAHQVETCPTWILVLQGGVGYGATMLISTYIATRLAGHTNRNNDNACCWHGYGVGAFLFSMIVWNMTMLPYPTWYGVLMFVEMPAAIYYGTKAARIFVEATTTTTTSNVSNTNNDCKKY